MIAPNFKRRQSGVTSTVARLVPLQARDIGITTCAPDMPDDVPNVSWLSLITMSRHGPSGARVWHARRNVEMIAGLLLKTLLRKRLRLVFTSASQRTHTPLTKWLIARMDAVVSTSAKSAAYLDRPSQVIQHGIDCDMFTPAKDRQKLRTELGLPQGPLLGCFGRIRAQKGTDIFVDAMIDLFGRRPEGSAIVVGRASDKDRGFVADLKARIENAGLGHRILFLSEVTFRRIPLYYQALDLYVAPQRWEGFGLTPFEAMACGVPVVATRVGAFEELMCGCRTERLVPAGDLGAMIQTLDRTLDALAVAHSEDQDARAHIVERYQLNQEANALLALYRELLSRETP